MPDDFDEFLCIHDLAASTCSICLNHESVGEHDLASHSEPIIAKYDGYCPGCGGPIYGGSDEIYFDGTAWCHVSC